MRNTGNTFPDVPRFAGVTYYRVRAHLAPLIVMSCIVMHMFALYLLFLPPLLSLDTETDAAASLLPSTTTVLTTPPSCQSNQASPSLDHQISPIPSLYCLH